ncbi:MAG: DUF5615 family PIN-like protein [Fimbriimonadaceae bacterium]|nr:DUF5615 family PIN-like protein [Fimbriimonadaceae bacterium]
MTLWLDAHLSPALAPWIDANFECKCVAIRDLALRDASDIEIYNQAKIAENTVVVVSKDSDFVDLVIRLGSPPQLLWITCGNTSNEALKVIFKATLHQAIELLKQGESLVEIGPV